MADHVAGHDLVKTTVGLSRYGLSGYAVFDALVERGIVIEKAGLHTITLITTFQLAPEAVDDTVDALVDVLGGAVLPGGAREPMAANPFSAIDDRPVMHPYAARRYAKSIGHEVRAARGGRQGRRRARRGLPAGDPLILEGFRVSADAVDYLLEARDKGAPIVAATRAWRRCGSSERRPARRALRRLYGCPPRPTSPPPCGARARARVRVTVDAHRGVEVVPRAPASARAAAAVAKLRPWIERASRDRRPVRERVRARGHGALPRRQSCGSCPRRAARGCTAAAIRCSVPAGDPAPALERWFPARPAPSASRGWSRPCGARPAGPS